MATKDLTSEPSAVFPDPACPPDESALSDALGYAYSAVEAVRSWLRWAHEGVREEWQFSKTHGWYLVVLQKRRRLFYLTPQRDDFRLTLILGDKALRLLKNGPFAQRVEWMLQSAKRYPEGTSFTFRHSDCDPDLIIGMLEAKLAL